MATKDETVAIETVTIKVGGKSLVFKVDDARKLYECLEELFGEKTKYVSTPTIIRDYWPLRPWWHGDTWYSTSGGSLAADGRNLMCCVS